MGEGPAPVANPNGGRNRWTGGNENVRACAGRSYSGTEALARLILSSFQGMWNGRTYGCTYMNPTRPARPPYRSGSLSDHASGAAFDAMLPRVGDPIGQRLADWCVRNFVNLGMKYVIYNRRIYDGSSWRRYSGSNAHVDHVHISLLIRAAQGLTEADIVPALTSAGFQPGSNTGRRPSQPVRGSRVAPARRAAPRRAAPARRRRN